MRSLLIVAMAACLVASPALADKPQSKGKDEPRGQTVSGCNHQANDLELKGDARKRFVERCMRRGGDAWGSGEWGRNCRERAERMGLKGDARDDFIRRCREYRDDEAAPRPYGKDEKKNEPAFNPRDPDGERGKKDR
jgi:hypothetical protein